MKGAGGGEQDDERGARHTGNTLAREHQGGHHQELLADGEFDARCLRDEDARHGEVECRSVEVEAVSGWDDERYHPPGDAESLHGLHGAWKGGFAGRGREGDRGRLGYSGEKARDRYAKKQRRGQQDQNAE